MRGHPAVRRHHAAGAGAGAASGGRGAGARERGGAGARGRGVRGNGGGGGGRRPVGRARGAQPASMPSPRSEARLVGGSLAPRWAREAFGRPGEGSAPPASLHSESLSPMPSSGGSSKSRMCTWGAAHGVTRTVSAAQVGRVCKHARGVWIVCAWHVRGACVSMRGALGLGLGLGLEAPRMGKRGAGGACVQACARRVHGARWAAPAMSSSPGALGPSRASRQTRRAQSPLPQACSSSPAPRSSHVTQ